MKNHFEGYHRVTVFLYFMLIVAMTLLLSHPAFLLLSACVSFFYAALLGGGKTAAGNLLLFLPVLLFPAIINPLVNHRGDTPFLYLNGRPLTLESLLYGLFAGVMVAAMLFWFQAYSKTLGSTRFLSLFGKYLPAVSLMATMVFRLIPRFGRELKEIAAVQKGFGLTVSGGRLMERLKAGGAMLSVLVSVTLEDSLQTADSMKSRGYGLGRKTSVQQERFSPRDGILLGVTLMAAALLCLALSRGSLSFAYFPRFAWPALSGETAGLLILYGLLLGVPMLVNLGEEIRWRCLRSKISPSPTRANRSQS